MKKTKPKEKVLENRYEGLELLMRDKGASDEEIKKVIKEVREAENKAYLESLRNSSKR